MYDYLRKAVQQFPEKIAIKYKDVELSYSELDDVIKKIADECFADIERCNIGIVVNSPMLFTMSLMAVSYLGCVAVPIYAHTGKEKIKELVKQFSLEYVIFEKGYDVLNCEESTTVLSDLIIHKEVSVGKNHSDKNCEIILLTSGTTGAPKGIMLSRDNIKSNVEAIGDYLRLTLNDKIFMVKNMNHSSSIIGELLVGLDNMCTIVFNSKVLTASSMVNSICDNNITVFFAVPTILREIILKHKQLNLEKIGHLNVAAIYTMYGALSIRFLQFGKSYPELMNCLAYAERVFEFLQIDEERDILNSETTVRVINCENAVEVVDISFSYDGKCKVFEKRSLLIEKNKTVAIVGKSGGGKSTLAKLMLGFYNIQEGDILLFGTSIKKLGLINARNLIAYIPQEPYLFGVSIKENIRYGNLKASDEEIIIAAKHANAHDFIMNQKEGYDTLIINGGKSLSGGERQRIAIARAIIKDAPIILMDEATSALDNESERRIHEALEQLKHNKTVIVIAHRPETINIADTVVEV